MEARDRAVLYCSLSSLEIRKIRDRLDCSLNGIGRGALSEILAVVIIEFVPSASEGEEFPSAAIPATNRVKRILLAARG